VIGHVGDGNFHQTVMYNAEDPIHVSSVSRCVHRMMENALEMEGTVTVRLSSSPRLAPRNVKH
jgi:D-lactate dehydrogenase (cytochrome)